MSGKAENTRRYIIEQAAPIFNKKGFAGTSLQDLLQATGLSKGALYGNFRNKDEIALAVFDYQFDQIKEGLLKLSEGEETAYGRLKAFLRFYRQSWCSLAENGGCPVLNAVVEADDNQPLLLERVRKSLQYWQRGFEITFILGMERAEFSTDLNPAREALYLMTLIEGGVLLARGLGQDLPFTYAMDQAEERLETLRNK